MLLFLCWWLQLLRCYYFLAHIRTRILISRCCVAVLVLVVTTAMLLLLCLNSNTRILNSRCCVFCCYYFLTQIRTRSSSRSRSGRSTAKTTQHVLVFFASLLRTMTDHCPTTLNSFTGNGVGHRLGIDLDMLDT